MPNASTNNAKQPEILRISGFSRLSHFSETSLLSPCADGSGNGPEYLVMALRFGRVRLGFIVRVLEAHVMMTSFPRNENYVLFTPCLSRPAAWFLDIRISVRRRDTLLGRPEVYAFWVFDDPFNLRSTIFITFHTCD
jgi:hypothetical protein